MTIRLAEHMRNIKRHPFVSGYLINSAGGVTLAGCDTEAEAQAAQRAFENVLAPRFTRDEAIAIVRAALGPGEDFVPGSSHVRGVRLALEALAAAGVFVDDPRGDHPNDMRDKLDRAGIR